MTENDIKLQAAKFYSKINFDRYPPDQRAAAEEMIAAGASRLGLSSSRDILADRSATGDY